MKAGTVIRLPNDKPPRHRAVGYQVVIRACVTIPSGRHSGRTERSEVPVLHSGYATDCGRSGIQEKGIILWSSRFRLAPRYTGLGRNDEYWEKQL